MNRRRVTGISFCAMAIGAAALIVIGSWNLRAAEGNAGPDGNADNLGFDVSHMDKTCKPCDDFFQYVNGNWIKNNPIPPEYASWGSGSMLHDNNQKQLRTLLDEAAANTSAGHCGHCCHCANFRIGSVSVPLGRSLRTTSPIVSALSSAEDRAFPRVLAITVTNSKSAALMLLAVARRANQPLEAFI